MKRTVSSSIRCALTGQPLLEFKEHTRHTCHIPLSASEPPEASPGPTHPLVALD